MKGAVKRGIMKLQGKKHLQLIMLPKRCREGFPPGFCKQFNLANTFKFYFYDRTWEGDVTQKFKLLPFIPYQSVGLVPAVLLLIQFPVNIS